jgi:hydroxymethylglutaryl-CoA lyase
MSDLVRIYEVSPRDGLQNEPEVLATEVKREFIARLVATGVRDIEVSSFVSPRWIPQLADADQLVPTLPHVAGVRYWGLVPNPQGLERALEAGLRHVATFLSASESHNRKNVNRTVRESLAGLRKVIETANAERMTVRSYVSTAFGCPYEGDVDERRVVDIAGELLAAGADHVALGDTTGMGNPIQVRRLVERCVAAGIPIDRIAVHFHDTTGTALVNAWAAYLAGVRMFDGSVAGIGGCPYAPGAAGNLATEDLVHLFHELGIDTGVDLGAAAEAGAFMASTLGRKLPGRYQQWWQGQRVLHAQTA